MFSAIHYLSNAMITTIIVLDKIELDIYLAKPGHLICQNKHVKNNL